MPIKWKDIIDAPGYEICSDGRVRHGTKQMKTTPGSNGYCRFNVRIDGSTSNRYVHSCMAEAFISPRPNKDSEVRHLDGVKLHNRIRNLRWGTVKKNAEDRISHGTNNHGERNGRSKLKIRDILRARGMRASGKLYREIARCLKISGGHAWSICNHIYCHRLDADQRKANAKATRLKRMI